MRNRLLCTFLIVLVVQLGWGQNVKKNAKNTKSVKPAKEMTLDQFNPMTLVLPEPTGTDDSPIIVSSGSFHIRQKDWSFIALNHSHYYLELADHTAESIQFGTCDVNMPVTPGHCAWANNSMLAGVWSLKMTSSSGTIATLTLPDAAYPGFITMSTDQLLTPELDNGISGNKGDGEGYMTNGVNLTGAQLTINSVVTYTWNCTPATGKNCTIRVRYCKLGAACAVN